MWRRRMIQRVTAATGLKITAQHRGETQNPRSNRSMSLKGEKSSMVVLWAEGSCYNMKGSVDVLMVQYGDKQAGKEVRDA